LVVVEEGEDPGAQFGREFGGLDGADEVFYLLGVELVEGEGEVVFGEEFE